MISKQRLEFVFKETLDIAFIDVNIHRIWDLLAHLKIRYHLKRLNVNLLANPNYLSLCIHLLENGMLKVFRYLVLAETEIVHRCATQEAIQYLHCLLFRANVEVVIC